MEGWKGWAEEKPDMDAAVAFLMNERYNLASPLRPYLGVYIVSMIGASLIQCVDSLPQSFPEVPLLWEDDELEVLAFTGIDALVRRTRVMNKRSYERYYAELFSVRCQSHRY